MSIEECKKIALRRKINQEMIEIQIKLRANSKNEGCKIAGVSVDDFRAN